MMNEQQVKADHKEPQQEEWKLRPGELTIAQAERFFILTELVWELETGDMGPADAIFNAEGKEKFWTHRWQSKPKDVPYIDETIVRAILPGLIACRDAEWAKLQAMIAAKPKGGRRAK